MQRQRFSTYLLTGFVILIFTSTISAGAPAYWLTRNQLERQAWANVENAQQATLSLLAAEQTRLSDLATIFAERPTLRRLVQTGAWAELQPFLTAFQAQSKVDLLLFCNPSGERVAGSPVLERCPAINTPQFVLITGQPALSEVATLSTALIKSQASMLRALEERSQARDWLNNSCYAATFGNAGIPAGCRQRWRRSRCVT